MRSLKTFLLFGLFLILCSSCKLGRFVYYNFADITDHKIFPARKITKGETVFQFQKSDAKKIPDSITVTFKDKKQRLSFEQYLKNNKTVAFLVIQNDSIHYEKYLNEYNEASVVASFSMAKSIISILIGCALDDGFIKSIDEPIINYLPEYKEKGFEKVTIKHLLQMTSGIGFNESYYNPFGEAASFYYGRNLEKDAGKLKLTAKPGTQFSYSSGDSQILGLVLAKALKTRTISSYLEEKLWQPLQMEYDASWSLDKKGGIEKTFCCVNARARDFAKIGRLYLNKGNWNGKQIVSEKWVEESTTAEQKNGGVSYYQHQWWLTQNGDFMAQGILGQYIYVNPSKNMIIVRLGKDHGKTSDWKTMFQSIASRG